MDLRGLILLKLLVLLPSIVYTTKSRSKLLCVHDWLRSVSLRGQYWILLGVRRLRHEDSMREVRIVGWVAKWIGLWVHHHSVVRRTVHVYVVANVKSLCATRCVDWHTSGHHVVPIHAWMHVRPLHVALWVLVNFASPLICLRVLIARPSVSTVLKLKMLLLSGLLLVIWFIDRVDALCLVATPVLVLSS